MSGIHGTAGLCEEPRGLRKSLYVFLGLKEADERRDEAWEVMRRCANAKFFLLIGRLQRMADSLPKDRSYVLKDIMLIVTRENQRRANEV